MTDNVDTERPDNEDRERAGRAEPMERLVAVEQRVEDVAQVLDDLEGLLQQLLLTAADPAGTEDTAADTARDDHAAPDVDEPGDENDGGGLDMRTLVAWVRDNIALLIERKMPQSGGWPHWCPMWWLHPEAIARFEALRRAWLDAIAESGGSGLVVYFEHVDLQLATLCADNGPFSGCIGRHNPAGPAQRLGHLEPDEGYYLQVKAATASGFAPPPPAPHPVAPRPVTPPHHPDSAAGGGYARAGPAPGAGPAPIGMPRNGHGMPPQRR